MLGTLIDTDALWKIALAAFAGGVGVTAIFGFLLTRAQAVADARRRGADGVAALNSVAVVLCGAVCLVAIALGLVAMTHK